MSSEEDRRAQYHEIWENLRHHQNLIWATPSVAVALGTGVIIGAFRFVDDIVAREMLLGLGAAVTFVLFAAMTKNRYFYNIERQTLRELEKDMRLKLLQGKTMRNEPEDPAQFWYWKRATMIERMHAHEYLKWMMMGIFVLFLVLMLVTGLNYL